MEFLRGVSCHAERSTELEEGAFLLSGFFRVNSIMRLNLIVRLCSKYFDPNEDGAFDSYGSAGGQYEPYDHITGELSN